MTMRGQVKAWLGILLAAVFVLLISGLPLGKAYAAGQITVRSLTLQAGATDGGSMPGGTVDHQFAFTLPTSASIGSILFEYCTLAAGICTLPGGLVTTGATLGTNSGVSGVTLNNSTNGAPYVTRTAAAVTGGTAVVEQLLGVVNPSATNQTFFVRITTYTGISATGTVIDAGTVAASTATQIVLTGVMPESLVFCTGGIVSTSGGVPDCATATAGAVNFNQLFSPTDTATARSQMAASTNAGSGYAITVNGTTLTSGSNTVTAMGTSTTGVRGTSQFGLNLKANTTTTSTPAIGVEVAPAANAINYRGQAITGYNVIDDFKYLTGDTVANSSNGGAGGSDAQIFTVTYIANVPGSQPAGTYTTTLTFICTPTF